MSEQMKSEQPGASASPPTSTPTLEEVNIAKAVRFWKHPSLKDIPMEQKRLFLYEKGVTDAQIHRAWDRILEEEDCTSTSPHPPSSMVAVPGTPVPPPRYPTGMYPASNSYQNQASTYPSMPPFQPQNSGSYPQQRYEEQDEGPGPFLRGISLVALGGFVGLTAAAAARWLNGGEFEMLPPPVVPSKEDHTQERHVQEGELLVQGDGDDDHEIDCGDSGDEDYVEDEEEDVEEEVAYVTQIPDRLMEQVESIAETMKTHVSVQEKILQKLSTNGSAITNQSMELLRASSDISHANNYCLGHFSNQSSEALQLWAELLQIKGELRTLLDSQGQKSQCDNDQTFLNERVGATILKLDSCIESIGGIFAKQHSSADSARVALVTISADNSCSAPTTEPMQSTSTAPLPNDNACTSGQRTVRQSISRMAQAADPVKIRVACQLLYLYLVNLTGAPTNPRYRKIFTGNDNFKKVDAVDGAKSLLLAVGFTESKGCLEWLVGTSSTEHDELALRTVQEVLQALSILKTGQLSPELEAKALAVLSLDSDTLLSDLEEEIPTLQEKQALGTISTAGDNEETKSVQEGLNAGNVPPGAPKKPSRVDHR